MAGAKRPLIAIELQHALSVDIREPNYNKDNLPQFEDII